MCNKNVDIDDYKQDKYRQWQDNPESFYPGLRYNLQGIEGFSTLCPPIPWFGNINRHFTVVSLEPLLTHNCEYQVKIASEGEEQWNRFYLTGNYFNNLYADELSLYWMQLAEYVKGFLNSRENELKKVLSYNVCEFPFIQYHKRAHQKYQNYTVTQEMIDDLTDRICFGKINHKLKVVYFNGRNKWNKIKQYLSFHDIEEIKYNLYNDERSSTDVFRVTCERLGKVFVVIAPQFSYRWHWEDNEIENRGRILRNFLSQQP